MKRYLFVIALLLLAFSAQAKSLRVTILLAEEGASYSEFARSFANEAARNNLSLSIDQTSSLPQETDLLVAVGTKSAAMALNSRFPVLVVLVSKAGFEKLQHQILDHLENNIFSAIYLDQPSRRQIDLIAVVLPNVKNVGLFVSAQSADMTSLRKAMTERRFVLHEQQLESDETLHRDLHSLLQKSEILFAIPDAQIYNSTTMRNILLETYRSGIPIIGFSPAYVRAGALCAVFSTPEQIAKQAVSQARQFAESGRLSAIQYPSEFEVMVNLQVARSLGIDIKDAATLVRQMNAATVAGGRK